MYQKCFEVYADSGRISFLVTLQAMAEPKATLPMGTGDGGYLRFPRGQPRLEKYIQFAAYYFSLSFAERIENVDGDDSGGGGALS